MERSTDHRRKKSGEKRNFLLNRVQREMEDEQLSKQSTYQRKKSRKENRRSARIPNPEDESCGDHEISSRPAPLSLLFQAPSKEDRSGWSSLGASPATASHFRAWSCWLSRMIYRQRHLSDQRVGLHRCVCWWGLLDQIRSVGWATIVVAKRRRLTVGGHWRQVERSKLMHGVLNLARNSLQCVYIYIIFLFFKNESKEKRMMGNILKKKV